MKNKPKVLILAAGVGSRLQPYTLDRPKCMVEIAGRGLLERQLDVLYSENLSQIILLGGHCAQMLKIFELEVIVNPRYFETNMLWTLFSAQDELEGEVIISYGDIVYSKKVLKSVLDSNDDIAVAIDLKWESYWRTRNENPLHDAETLKLGTNSQIIEIGQKPKTIDEIQGQYMGLIKLSPAGVKIFKSFFKKSLLDEFVLGKKPENAYMTDLLQAIIQAGIKITAVPVYGEWVEVDTVGDLFSDVVKQRLVAIDKLEKVN